MSATGYTPIQLYRTTTAAATPSAGNLAAGELAINLTDEKLFFKNASGTVKVLASTGAGNAGGSNTQVQYNSSGVLTGSSNFVFDGTNVGIGTTAPTTLLDVFSATAANLSVRGNSSTNITAHRSSTDAIGPNSVLRKSRGTSDSQTAVASGDTMGTLFFSAYGGTNNRNIASIAGVVDTYSTDASIGSYLTFSTTPNGSVTPAERMRITSTGGITSSDLADAVGYKGLPQNAQTSSYTLALSDMGKHISITTGGVVIPADASVAFPIGSAIAIYNNSGSNQTISITSDTLRQAGTANTGSRTLAQYGLCTVTKVASTTWVISGAGVS